MLSILNHPISTALELLIIPFILGIPWDCLLDDHYGLQRTKNWIRPFRLLLYGFIHLGLFLLLAANVAQINRLVHSVMVKTGFTWLATATLMTFVTIVLVLIALFVVNGYILPRRDLYKRTSIDVFRHEP